ncbi:hypothetical protein M513_04156 [Trichuris suis]|uniref:Uncharacterized protein n=1 Tax=Trichuris suis TaxID=68888 RepID=A0A085MCM8_9BILA|nr:hypothetical protein M513_04156 [Trichuris suis]
MKTPPAESEKQCVEEMLDTTLEISTQSPLPKLEVRLSFICQPSSDPTIQLTRASANLCSNFPGQWSSGGSVVSTQIRFTWQFLVLYLRHLIGN